MEKSGLDDMEVTMQVLDEKIKRLKSRESPSAKKEAVTPKASAFFIDGFPSF